MTGPNGFFRCHGISRFAMELPFARPAPQKPDLAALWARARTVTVHPPGCPCVTRGFGVTLDARMIEDDILDYLHARYEMNGRMRLAAVVEGRRGALMAPAGAAPFEDWLATFSALPEEDRAAIEQDLAQVLASFTGADDGGFECA